MNTQNSSAAHPFAWNKRAWLILAAFVVAGFAIRLGAAVLHPTVERPDEIFQNLEPAYRLLAGQGIVSWEWRVGIRSWLFPAGLYGVMALAKALHLSAGSALVMIWAALAVVASGVVAAGVVLGWRRFGMLGAILCGILTAFWPDLVYYGPKTLGEVQAGNILVVAAALASVAPKRFHTLRLLAIGLLLGLAFDLRFQLAVPMLLVAVWAARFEVRRSWLPLLAGALIPVAALGLTDWWTLGSPFQSVWKNIQVNMFEHKAVQYGAAPFYRYLTLIVTRNGSAALTLAVLFIYGFRLAPLLGLTAISVVVFHSLIAHKEISFIYAALPCAMITVGLGAARFIDGLQRWLKAPPSPVLATAAAGAVALAAVVAVDFSGHPFTHLPPETDLASLFATLRTEPDLCGLGLVTREKGLWYNTGGYTFLRRPVPMYLTLTPQHFAQSRTGFNYAIVQRSEMWFAGEASILRCENDFCLVHYPTQCQPTTANEISQVLTDTDQ